MRLSPLTTAIALKCRLFLSIRLPIQMDSVFSVDCLFVMPKSVQLELVQHQTPLAFALAVSSSHCRTGDSESGKALSALDLLGDHTAGICAQLFSF
jgi:hypothetical protein